MTIHQFTYLNKSKIDNLYAQTVERVEEEYKTTHSTEIGGEGHLSIGKIANVLGLPEIGGDLSGKNANSNEVVLRLTPENKLKVIQAILITYNECTNLNQIDRKIIPEKVGKFVSIKAQFQKTKRYDKGSPIFELESAIFDYTLKITASNQALIGGGAGEYIGTGGYRMDAIADLGLKVPLRVFGTLVAWDIQSKIGAIDPIAIHYT